MTSKTVEEILKDTPAHVHAYLPALFDQVAETFRQGGWIGGPTSVNENGDTVDPLSMDAVKWCFTGCLMRHLFLEPGATPFRNGSKEQQLHRAALKIASAQVPPDFRASLVVSHWAVIDYNDTPDRTAEEMIGVATRSAAAVRFYREEVSA